MKDLASDDVDDLGVAELGADRQQLVQRQLHAAQIGVEGHPPPRSVVDGAFSVLKALPFSPSNGQISALSRSTGLPRPTVHRILNQLRDVGAVSVVAGRWTLAAGLYALASVAEPDAGLRSAMAAPMRALRERTGATVSCVVRDGTRAFVLDVVQGRDDLPVDIFPGREMPSGSAAALVLEGNAAARRLAVDREDVVPGLTCFATVVTLPLGRRAALQISTPPSAPAEAFGTLTIQASAAIRRSMAPN